VRSGVAKNSDIPNECACDIFRDLAYDEEDYVRMSVAENTNIPKECAYSIFKKLIEDKDLVVRDAVSQNKLYRKLLSTKTPLS
jgi:3-methyladenine DNA glycosylase AlkC